MTRNTEHEEAVNADSFLDIVASVVSVMIIMIVMTGLKIKSTHQDEAVAAEVAHAADKLAQKRSDERALHAELDLLAQQMREVQAQTIRRGRERDALALAANALDQELRGAHKRGAEQSAAGVQVAAQVADARTRLDLLNRQREAIEKSPAATVQIESYNTPLGQTVVGREVHFQLHHGRIAYVPLAELLERAHNDAQSKVERLFQHQELSDTVGPLEDFRMRYTYRLRKPTIEEVQELHSERPIQEYEFVLHPLRDDAGETIAEALAPGSRFHEVVSGRGAKDATITLWTYPDSFDNFRQLKKELYRLGFPVAARPLPEGAPIAGSSHGSKSTAE